MTRVMKLLSRLFPHEEIDGANRVEKYLDRWVLFRGRRSSWYLHRFSGSDWSRDLHDHPKPFLSIGLRGNYVETLGPLGSRRYVAPWIRRFPPEHRHRIVMDPGQTCWTLVRVGETEREWGFWCDGEFVDWRTYVYSDLPEKRGAVREDV